MADRRFRRERPSFLQPVFEGRRHTAPFRDDHHTRVPAGRPRCQRETTYPLPVHYVSAMTAFSHGCDLRSTAIPVP
nr:hypothetical protein JVH1_3680 [Rhodococcus sp. JVH1]